MPRLGLGTWLAYDQQVIDSVEHAIDIGYRHIDCAHIYLNEMDVGKALTNKIEQGVVKRSDLWLVCRESDTYGIRTVDSNFTLAYSSQENSGMPSTNLN